MSNEREGMRIVLVPSKKETRVWFYIYTPISLEDPLIVTLVMRQTERDGSVNLQPHVTVVDAWHSEEEVLTLIRDEEIVGMVLKPRDAGAVITVPTRKLGRYKDVIRHYGAFTVTWTAPTQLLLETNVCFKHKITTQEGQDVTHIAMEQQYPLLGDEVHDED